ncbi:phospholipid methyltransferase [Neoconidiobolus thromboides FSU 785]|nr:phospholipid methyltransferase [Neoconidiobolus thromboides FSU 785]
MLSNFPIDWNPTIIYISALSICFNPIFWNIVARNEYKNKTLTKIVGNSTTACYFLAFTIFSLGLIRDYLYKLALESQPINPILDNLYIKAIGALLISVGNIFVITSTYKLGITGTFLGDYFGILMDAPVTSFPFNVSNNPMYHGSSLIFLGTGLWYARSVGIVLTGLVVFIYSIATSFENPFTTMIYQKRDEERKKDAKKEK